MLAIGAATALGIVKKYPDPGGAWVPTAGNAVNLDAGFSNNYKNEGWSLTSGLGGFCEPAGCSMRVLFMRPSGAHYGVVDGDRHAVYDSFVVEYSRAKCQNLEAGTREMHCEKTRT